MMLFVPLQCVKANTLIGASILFSGHPYVWATIWWVLYYNYLSIIFVESVKKVTCFFNLAFYTIAGGWHNLPCAQYIQCCTHLFPWHHRNATKLILVGFNIGISPRIYQLAKFKPLLKFCRYTVCYHDPIKDTLPLMFIT